MSLELPVQYTWKQVLRSNLKYLFLGTLIFFVIFQHINLHMLIYFEHRPESVVPYDPLMRLITPRPINFELNLFSYSTLLVLLIYFIKRPRMLLIILHALLMMWMLRWFTMYLLPLAAPPDKVPLHDVIAYSNYSISRDLFFSGHTATLVIMLCAIKNRWMFMYAFIMALVIIALLLIGHQHYLLDIISAPFFAIICYQVSLRFSKFLVPLLFKSGEAVLEEEGKPDEAIG